VGSGWVVAAVFCVLSLSVDASPVGVKRLNFGASLNYLVSGFQETPTLPMKKQLPLNANGVHAFLRRATSNAILLLILLCVTALSRLSVAQQIPRVQVFGGYSYTRFDSPTLGFANRSNLSGFNISPAFNLAYGFGVKVELTGQYGSKVNLRDLTVGPQFLYSRGRTLFFAHALFGDSRSFVRVGTGEGDTARAIVLGGGVDLDVSSRFAFRAVQVDYVHTTLFSTTQNNVRISTGLVYRWHTIRRKGRKPTLSSP